MPWVSCARSLPSRCVSSMPYDRQVGWKRGTGCAVMLLSLAGLAGCASRGSGDESVSTTATVSFNQWIGEEGGRQLQVLQDEQSTFDAYIEEWLRYADGLTFEEPDSFMALHAMHEARKDAAHKPEFRS